MVNIFIQVKVRVIASVLCALMVFSTAAPTASAIASHVQDYTNNPPSADHKGKPLDTTTKMHTNYASALATGSSGIKLAADTSTNALLKSTQDNPLASTGTTTGPGVKQQSKHEEIVSKRTLNTKTFDLGNGKMEVRDYPSPVHFKNSNGNLQQIDTHLVEDSNAAESTNLLGKGLAWVKGETQTLHTYKVKANNWQAKFAASNDPVGMVRIEAQGKKIGFSPRGAAEGVVPDIQTNDQGVQTVTYKNLWPGTDVVYSVKNEMLKEEILLKDTSATTNFAYDIKGASLTKNEAGGFDIDGTNQSLTELSVTLQKAGPTSEKVISQDYKDGVLRMTLDKSWLQSQSSDQFPVVIDPSWNGPTVSWNYTTYKSDGYVCSSSSCYMNAGQLYDNGYKNWRTVMCTGDISFLAGKQLLDSGMYLQQADRSYLVGVGGARIFTMQHANSFSYGGIDGGAPANAAVIDYGGWIDTTSAVQFEVNRADWGPCWSMWGEVYGTYTSYKGFDPDISYMSYVYNNIPATPTVVTPQNGQTFVDPQASFQVNPVGDVDGDPVHYYFRIATGADGESGTLINSGDLNSPQWTVPDGVLQDGGTYYLHAYSRDTYGYSAPSAPIKFKIDSRRGKDKTQTYDTVGPASVDLTNGNVSTSVSSHDTSALGGNLGVSLDYNSPQRSRQGLVGSYWNNINESGSPVLTRVDKNISFNWTTGSPSAGLVPDDNFSAQWKGYFVAPTAGTYYFGGSNDDSMAVTVNGQSLYGQACYSGICYDMTKSVTLTAGQVAPIQIDYAEGTSTAYALLYVKGAVSERVVPQEWLQTGARPITQPHGLTGSYYANNTGYNLDASDKQLLVKRVDPALSFNWGAGGPVPDVATDFMARWSGYITLSGGDYNFGTNADDAAKITVGSTLVADNYSGTCCTEKYGATTHFNAGTYPIQIDYYDVGGPASLSVLVKINGAANGQVIPSDWLSPSAQVLPAGWQLGLDPDGDLSYDHLTANDSTVTLSDSTGDTHAYTWTGSGYKPPVNEDGQLTHGTDGRYTLIDTDGRTYVFKPDGTLESVTNPVDDLKPAALQYTYEGTPAHIAQISDGVDSNRYAKIYYAGDGKNMCAARPDASYVDPSDLSITGYICGVQTNDGRTTSFFYSNSGGATQLALVVKPGNERTSYQYDATGMMTAVRDSLAEDAIAAGIRANDSTALTQLTYDVLGRATGVTAPAANTGDSRQQQTFAYGPVDDATKAGYTFEHIVGDAEPNGYTRRVDYDGTFRTTKDTDVTGNATIQQWDTIKDLLYSSTDATGLKSTTIYDTDDRPTDNYGPAPSGWFGIDNRPTASYVSQVPHTSSGYDEGIVGPAVTWYNYKSANGGTLTGTPKLHTTGFDGTSAGHLGRNFITNAAPVTPDAGMDGYGFNATGKLRLPSTGTYTFHLYTDDGAKLSVNDTQILSNWGTTTEGIAQNTLTGTFTTGAGDAVGTPYRFSLQYGHSGNPGGLELWISGPGITDTNNGLGTSQFGSYLSPDYSLGTSSTTYDSTLGNTATTTNFGSKPEYGLAQSSTIDPSGQNLTSSSTYEAPGSGYLRQTASFLPGANTAVASTGTQYAYYGATETRDNPCTTTVEAYRQGGMLKLKTEPDPDGTGSQTSRTTETVYDDSGQVVATRYNNDPWTCTTYDARGRVTETDIPAYNGNPARTVTNSYAVGGNPLEVSSTDGNGSIATWTDLLGRTTKYQDVYADQTVSTYDSAGRLSQRTSQLGTETFVYDTYNRLTDQKLNGTTYAHITYNAYSQIDNVTYPAAGQLKLTLGRDTLGRNTTDTYTLGDGTTQVVDAVTRSQSNQTLSDTVTSGSSSLASSYGYDTAGRLTSATIGAHNYAYSFGTQNASTCGTGAATNANSGKNSNRTSQTIDGTTTYYCYNYADQFTGGTGAANGSITYDTHGNMGHIGTPTASNPETYLYYDSSDRNSGMEQYDANGNGAGMYYDRDVQGRIIGRYGANISNWNWVNRDDLYYGFTGSGDTPDYVRNGSWTIVEKNLQLPGGVVVSLKPTKTGNASAQYSLPNIHGDILLTTNAAGTNTSTGNGPLSSFTYDPFGNIISGSTLPSNTVDGSYGWVGSNLKLTESTMALKMVQMGARVYLPTLGRFTSVDPVQGGTPNNYMYASDPVNQFDLSGNCIGPAIFLLPECIAVLSAAVEMYGGVGGGGMRAGAMGGATAGKAFSRAVKKEVLENENRCVYCRMKPKKAEVDHIIAKSKGGNATRQNAQLTCQHCNRSKGAGKAPKTPPRGYRGRWRW